MAKSKSKYKGITTQAMAREIARLESLIPSDYPRSDDACDTARYHVYDASETVEDASRMIAYSRAATQRLRRILDAATTLDPATREAITDGIDNAECGTEQLEHDTASLKDDADQLKYIVDEIHDMADQARALIAEWWDISDGVPAWEMGQWHDRIRVMADSLSSMLHFAAEQIDYIARSARDVGFRADVSIDEDLSAVITLMGKHGIFDRGNDAYLDFIDAVHKDMESA